MLKNPIEIKDFHEGFTNYNGKFERMVNVDTKTIVGSILVNTKPIDIKVSDTDSLTGLDFTASTDDTLTIASNPFFTGQAVQLTTTDTLPSPLATSTTYYVIYISSTTIKLATTLYNADAETAIDITDIGTGTHTITGVQMGNIIKIIRNPQALGSDYNYYAIDESGKIWVSYNGYYTYIGGNTAGDILGAEIYKDYLFVFRNNKIDVYGSLDNVGNTATWTNSWKTITNDSSYHPSLVGQDDVLYIGAGKYIVSLEEVTTFDPSSSGTYSFNAQALDLSSNYKIKTLAELGTYLAIGTWMGANTFDLKVADIFLWDRVSTTFELPLRIKENGVNAMITINNLLYVVAGHNGNIYVTNGTSVELFTKIPKSFFHIINEYSLYFEPNAIMLHQGRLFLGVGSFTTGNTAVYPLGILSIDLDKGYMVLENTISTGNDGNGNHIRIGAMISTSDYNYQYSWWDNSQTYQNGIDYNYNNRHLYTGYTAYIETGLYQISTEKQKETLSNFEVFLSKRLRPNQSIKLEYRESLNDAYQEICIVSYSNTGSKFNKSIEKSLSNLSAVQFKVSFDFSSTETESIPLKSINIS